MKYVDCVFWAFHIGSQSREFMFEHAGEGSKRKSGPDYIRGMRYRV